jgi:hypothetical protein
MIRQMDEKKVYHDWVCSRKSMGLPEKFSKQFIAHLLDEGFNSNIDAYEDIGAEPFFMTGHIQRLALALGLSALGLFRLGYITAAILNP